MPHGITQCYMPPDRGDIPAFTHNRSLYSNWIQGWVDLVDLGIIVNYFESENLYVVKARIKARSPLTTYVLPFQPQSICSFWSASIPIPLRVGGWVWVRLELKWTRVINTRKPTRTFTSDELEFANYTVTRIIVNDFESENLYVVNLKTGKLYIVR